MDYEKILKDVKKEDLDSCKIYNEKGRSVVRNNRTNEKEGVVREPRTNEKELTNVTSINSDGVVQYGRTEQMNILLYLEKEVVVVGPNYPHNQKKFLAWKNKSSTGTPNNLIKAFSLAYDIYNKIPSKETTLEIIYYLHKNKFSYLSELSRNVNIAKTSLRDWLINLTRLDVVQEVEEGTPEITEFMRTKKNKGRGNFIFFELTPLIRNNMPLIDVMAINLIGPEKMEKLKGLKRSDQTRDYNTQNKTKTVMIAKEKVTLKQIIRTYILSEKEARECGLTTQEQRYESGWFLPPGALNCDNCGKPIKAGKCHHNPNHKYCGDCFKKLYPDAESRIKFIEAAGDIIKVGENGN